MKKSKTFVRRKKMGRPVSVPGAVSVTIKLPGDLLQRLDAHAAARELDRSAAVRAILERALKTT
jgi:hypothetical protein